MAKTKKPKAKKFGEVVKQTRKGKSLGFGRDKARADRR